MNSKKTTMNIIEDYREQIRDLKEQILYLAPKAMGKKCTGCNSLEEEDWKRLEAERDELKARVIELEDHIENGALAEPPLYGKIQDDKKVQRAYNNFMSTMIDKVLECKREDEQLIKNCTTCKSGQDGFWVCIRNLKPNNNYSCWGLNDNNKQD